MKTIQIVLGLSLLVTITTQAQMQLAAGVRLQQSAQSHLNATNGLKINAGAKFEVNGYVTVADELINQGGVGALEVKSTSFSQGSLIQPSQNTAATIQRYLSAESYHYLASPVNNQAIVPEFIPLTAGIPYATHDLYRYDEVNNTWVNIKNNDGSLNNSFEVNFAPMRGYALAYAESEYVRNFSGTLNAGILTTNLTKTANEGNGWNLIGNPYPSTLAANIPAQAVNNILSQNAAVLDDVYHALYLWNEQSDFDGNRNDYVTINQLSDPSWISLGQAFMVKAKNHNQLFTFSPLAQQHHEAAYYKAQNISGNDAFKIQLTGPLGDMNEIIIAFADGLTTGLDIGYDAGKLKGNQNLAFSMRLVQDNGFDYAIQGLPILHDSVKIDLVFDAFKTGFYHIDLAQPTSTNRDRQIILEDTYLQKFTLLNEAYYQFELNESGSFTDRFKLHLKINPTAVGDFPTPENFKIYFQDQRFVMHNYTSQEEKFVLQLFSATGALVYSKDISIGSKAAKSIILDLPAGMYIASLFNQKSQLTQKILIPN